MVMTCLKRSTVEEGWVGYFSDPAVVAVDDSAVYIIFYSVLHPLWIPAEKKEEKINNGVNA